MSQTAYHEGQEVTFVLGKGKNATQWTGIVTATQPHMSDGHRHNVTIAITLPGAAKPTTVTVDESNIIWATEG